jgi:hypothetical protein
MWLSGETEVLVENLPRRHFVRHKSHLPDPDANPGRRGGKPATNRFSYGAAMIDVTEKVSYNMATICRCTTTQSISCNSQIKCFQTQDDTNSFFFYVLVCGSRAQIFSAPFNFNLYRAL